MMATIGVRNIIEKNCDNKGSTKEAVRLLSNSLFEINQLEPLKCNFNLKHFFLFFFLIFFRV